jgi:hypothetical protein
VSSGPAKCRPELLAELADDLDVVIERVAPAPGASKKVVSIADKFSERTVPAQGLRRPSSATSTKKMLMQTNAERVFRL